MQRGKRPVSFLNRKSNQQTPSSVTQGVFYSSGLFHKGRTQMLRAIGECRCPDTNQRWTIKSAMVCLFPLFPQGRLAPEYESAITVGYSLWIQGSRILVQSEEVRATTRGRGWDPGLQTSSRAGKSFRPLLQFRLAGGSKCPQRAGVLRLLDREAWQLDPGIHVSQERELPTLDLL